MSTVSESNLLPLNDGIVSFTPELVALFKKILKKADPLDPYVTMRKSYLMKAFLTWSKCAPLIQLCGELKKQLQERCSIVESLRESYYKDVISVKYHLDRIGTLSKFYFLTSILRRMRLKNVLSFSLHKVVSIAVNYLNSC